MDGASLAVIMYSIGAALRLHTSARARQIKCVAEGLGMYGIGVAPVKVHISVV
jgi:hypothetical protein